MCRRATGTPMDCAFARSSNPFVSSDTEFLRIPLQPQLAGGRHVSDQRGRRDDRRAREVALAAEAHAILPVAIERRDRAFSFRQRVGALPETRTAPRLTDFAADGTKHAGDRVAV